MQCYIHQNTPPPHTHTRGVLLWYIYWVQTSCEIIQHCDVSFPSNVSNWTDDITNACFIGKSVLPTLTLSSHIKTWLFNVFIPRFYLFWQSIITPLTNLFQYFRGLTEAPPLSSWQWVEPQVTTTRVWILWRGHIWRVFHLWLRFITFGAQIIS